MRRHYSAIAICLVLCTQISFGAAHKKNSLAGRFTDTLKTGVPLLGGAAGIIASAELFGSSFIDEPPIDFAYHPRLTALTLFLASLKPLRCGLDQYAQLRTGIYPEPAVRKKLDKRVCYLIYAIRIACGLALPYLTHKEHCAQRARGIGADPEATKWLIIRCSLPVLLLMMELRVNIKKHFMPTAKSRKVT